MLYYSRLDLIRGCCHMRVFRNAPLENRGCQKSACAGSEAKSNPYQLKARGGVLLFLCDSDPFNQRFVSICCHLIVYITAYNEAAMNCSPSGAPFHFPSEEEK